MSLAFHPVSPVQSDQRKTMRNRATGQNIQHRTNRAPVRVGRRYCLDDNNNANTGNHRGGTVAVVVTAAFFRFGTNCVNSNVFRLLTICMGRAIHCHLSLRFYSFSFATRSCCCSNIVWSHFIRFFESARLDNVRVVAALRVRKWGQEKECGTNTLENVDDDYYEFRTR